MIPTFETYEEARDSVPDDQHVVCGTRLLDGSARYFVLRADTPDALGHDIAFEIRNGRLPSQYEKWLKEIAIDLRHTDEELVDA